MTGSKNIIIQPRDLKLLRTVALLRAVDRKQATTIGSFSSTTRVNATMLRLVKAGLLNRFFMGVGPGSQKSIYTVSRKGAELADSGFRRFRRENGELYSGDLFLEHQLLLNDTYLLLHKSNPGIEVRNWRTFDVPLPESSLIPDAYFELITNILLKPVFLEVDKGTESKDIWKKKTANYLSFASSRAFERQFNHVQFRVLVITTTEQKLKRIQSAISGQTSKIFWLTTFSDINTLGFFSAVWQRPNGREKVPLL